MKHCEYLHGPLHDHFATTYGISRNSISNTSNYFHCADHRRSQDFEKGWAQLIIIGN